MKISLAGLLLCALACTPAFIRAEGQIDIDGKKGSCLPGEGENPDPCVDKYKGTLCTAVDGSQVNKCALKGQTAYTCSGVNPGACPTKGGWTKDGETQFPDSVICAYQTQGITCKNASVGAQENEVECATFTVGQLNNQHGIFRCFDAKNVCSPEKASAVGPVINPCRKCITNNSTYELCNGRGACVANSLSGEDGAEGYFCQCDVQFSGPLCENVTSNVCDPFEDCGENANCDLTSGKCACEDGWTGDACTKCSKDSACQEKGDSGATCASGSCKCSTGKTGKNCEADIPDPTTEAPSDSPATTPQSGVSVTTANAMVATVVSLICVLVAAAF